MIIRRRRGYLSEHMCKQRNQIELICTGNEGVSVGSVRFVGFGSLSVTSQ
jgi:hypothetical protein